jgi:uncharacterized YccA/Bax inhibitor family protein
MFVMLLAYKFRIVQATGSSLSKFTATGESLWFTPLNMLMSLFGHSQMSFKRPQHRSTGVSPFVVIIASLNLIIDFDMIENRARLGAPKYMEGYGAFGLMVTLIWLYMEMLRLLSKVRRR